ncbi:MAG: hypothetical protein IPL39_08700 [Opitutaceae bacterium]|nr:hypothetical protein [Opitutaceae bacterium]
MGIFWGAILVGTVLWLGFAVLAHCNIVTGTFGDAFGALNTLFSGLAFAAIIYTVYLQREELSLQRKEMELTREELRGQKEQLEIQNRLTVQAAQLSAIPQLIEAEIQKLSRNEASVLHDWAKRPHSLEDLMADVDRVKAQIDKEERLLDEDRAKLAKEQAAPSAGAGTGLMVSSLERSVAGWEREIGRLKKGLTSLHRLIDLYSHLDRIYTETTRL